MSPSANNPTPRIAVVVVTRNRLALLQECLTAVRNQSRQPDEIIVVNNDSTDGTAPWLAAQQRLTVIHQANLGGAGGFHTGIKRAYQHGHDWLWCMDDDTIPAPDALEQLLKCPKARDGQTGVLCSMVRWTDGSVHRMNVPHLYLDYQELLQLFPAGILRVHSCSFVSALIHRRAIAAQGLPLRDMFVWYDDVEYTRRISAVFPCYQVLASVAEHRTKTNYEVDYDNMAGLSPVYLNYGLRNVVFFSGWEPALGWRRHWVRLKCVMRLRKLVRRQFRGAQRRRLERVLWRGIFFRPKIEMPDEA